MSPSGSAGSEQGSETTRFYESVAVYYYNFALKDYGDATMSKLLDMVKVVAFAVQEGRVAIHCHAGKSILFDGYIDPILTLSPPLSFDLSFSFTQSAKTG